LGGARAPLVGCRAISANEVTEIYACVGWYAERAEPEERWLGVLRRRKPPGGPAGRVALAYTRELEGRSVDVYAANVEAVLSGFVDRTVIAAGKLVNLSAEGFGEELWLASLRVASDGER
jgi:hypothetical protein